MPNTRSKASKKKAATPAKKKLSKVRVVDDPALKKDLNSEDIVADDSGAQYKSHLLALKLQAEEQQAEIERLKQVKSDGISKEDLETIEAGVEARLRKKLEEEFQAAEDRQTLCLSIFSHKIDKPFKGTSNTRATRGSTRSCRNSRIHWKNPSFT